MSRQSNHQRSTRIIKNTVFLFIRMFVLMLINLYAVRLLLQGLGKEDYGIYNAVAGVVTTLTCLSTVFSVATQRFFSVAFGKKDKPLLNKIFSTSLNINLMFSGVIILLFETVGLWFLTTHLGIPAERMTAANWIYQFALFSFINSILIIPFMSAVIAHEHMGYFTVISTIECLLKLVVVLMMDNATSDKLIFYGAGLWIVSLVVLTAYFILAKSEYPECHYQRVHDKRLYKELLSFSGWTLFGSVAGMFMIQGNTIMIQVFFGPIIVAAFAIALQINTAFTSLCSSVVMAIRPAMIQSYAEKNYGYLNQLFVVSNKFLFYILVLIAVPLIGEMNSVLNVWLEEPDTNMVMFSRFIIIYIIVLSMHNPITIIIQASGYVKQYHLIVETVTLLCLPLTWVLFSLGLPPYSVFLSMIGVCVIAHFARIYCLSRYYEQFSISDYLLRFAIPSCGILILTAALTWLIHANICDDYEALRVVTVCIVSPCILGVLVYFIGLTRGEKNIVRQKVGNIINHKR